MGSEVRVPADRTARCLARGCIRGVRCDGRLLWRVGRGRGRGLVRALASLVAATWLVAAAAEPDDGQHLERIQQPDKVDDAIGKGLAWLVTQQDLTYGWFAGSPQNTCTGLSCIALMAAGHFPGRSPYGEHLRRGVLFLAKTAKEKQGYLGGDGGRMYGHGICSLALAEAYGMMQDEKDNQQIREALDLVLALILKSQARAGGQMGGWRYEPTSQDADLSVTAWQILALRSAQNCRLQVPDESIRNALDYLRRSYHPGSPGFAYTPGGGASPAMRAAGVVCMLALGANKDPADQEKTAKSGEFLLTVNPAGGSHFYYQSYYFATAANMMGDEHRNALLPKMETVLLKLQKDNGEFQQGGGYAGGVYATAFAVICLAVRYQYLPIYQE